MKGWTQKANFSNQEFNLNLNLDLDPEDILKAKETHLTIH